jgi:hypothetical protein
MGPSYDLRPCTLAEVDALCARFHAYGGAGGAATYAFGVYEDGRLVAAYAWQPPAPGAAKSVCPACPEGVLALSRMVAVPREERQLRHISKPLRRQMLRLIDRTRWPVLVTYSDEGCGHTGYVYKCSGWQPTRKAQRPTYEDAQGRRCSTYRAGEHNTQGLQRAGTTTVQRWEHHVTADPAGYMAAHGWRRVPIEGKRWRSGTQAYTYVRVGAQDHEGVRVA